MSVRLRFAPSNTGFLHMGNARTALFNYLYTRHHRGTFILRIEDTDLERSKPEYTDAILEAMDWMGMHADEGPYFQTQRTAIYKEKVDALLANGHAYKCFATKEELELRRQEALESGGDLSAASRIWRDRDDHPQDAPFVVRFKSPLEGELTIDDMVQGKVTVSASELDDFVILRSDGTPTYNFTVVVDDVLMEVTHIVRGDDHLNNAFRQLPVYAALGAKPPRFAHLALVAGLSKRKGSTSVPEYRALGYLPEAVNNYLARLGWSHGDQEIFSMQELIEYFDFDHVGKSASQFDLKKFQWVNAEWMKRLPAAVLAERWLPFLQEAGLPAPQDLDSPEFAHLTQVCEALKERAKTLVEMTEIGAFFFTDSVDYDEKAADKWLVGKYAPAFEDLHARLSALSDWNADAIEAVYRELVETHELGLKHFAQPTRVCLTGSTSSPGVFETVALCGRERALERLSAGLERMKADQ